METLDLIGKLRDRADQSDYWDAHLMREAAQRLEDLDDEDRLLPAWAEWRVGGA